MARAIDRPHTATCARPEHLGPCDGPLRHELPETAAEREARQVDAVMAVLAEHGPAIAYAVAMGVPIQRELAEEIVAAAETGI